MKTIFYKLSAWLLIPVFGLLFFSCEKEKIYPDYKTTDELNIVMKSWYFWIDSVPQVNPDDYSNPYDLLEAMRYQEKDRWSYITTQDAFDQYYEEGTFVGFGFGYAPDADGNIRITFLYEDSDLYADGITRGWSIKEINGVAVNENSDLTELLGANEIGVSNDFVFESPEGEIISQSYTKKLVTMNTVLYRTVFDVGARKAGYLVLKSFIRPSMDDLE